MHHTLRAVKRALFSTVEIVLLTSVGAGLILGSRRLAGQALQATTVLDLTAEVPRNEQGYYHGIPGMSGGGGAWRPGPGDTVRYQLPLATEILHASPNKDGDFVVEVILRNIDTAPFNLPNSTNITAIETPGNKSRRIFFFKLQPVGKGAPQGEPLGFASTAGSTSVLGSFTPLGPGKSVRVLLLAPSASIRRWFTEGSEKLGATLTCQEWRLDENRFFLSGVSDQLASANTIQFALQGKQVTAVEP